MLGAHIIQRSLGTTYTYRARLHPLEECVWTMFLFPQKWPDVWRFYRDKNSRFWTLLSLLASNMFQPLVGFNMFSPAGFNHFESHSCDRDKRPMACQVYTSCRSSAVRRSRNPQVSRYSSHDRWVADDYNLSLLTNGSSLYITINEWYDGSLLVITIFTD